MNSYHLSALAEDSSQRFQRLVHWSPTQPKIAMPSSRLGLERQHEHLTLQVTPTGIARTSARHRSSLAYASHQGKQARPSESLGRYGASTRIARPGGLSVGCDRSKRLPSRREWSLLPYGDRVLAATGRKGRRAEMPLACVLGGMDLVTPLGRAGIRSAVVVPPGDPAVWSRHVVDVLAAMNSWTEPEAYLKRLVTWANGQEVRPILYYGTDGDLLMISRHRETLAEAFRFVVPEVGLVEDCVDKSRFAARARALGLRVPPSAVIPRDSVDLRFPMVAKPVSHADGVPEGFDGKATLVRTPADLRDLTGRVTGPLLLQELVPGPESRIESWHAYVDAQGVVADFSGAKLRTFPQAYGESIWLQITDKADVRAEGRRAAAALGLKGVCKIDFKRAPDGTLWLLEVNARFNLWHNLGAAAGVNLPAMVHADLSGLPRPIPGTCVRASTWVETRELLRGMTAEGEHARAWLAAVASSTTRSTGAWSDPMPLARGLLAPAAMNRMRRMRVRLRGGMR